MGGNGGQHGFRKRLAPTTALFAILLGGYSGREARAGACYASGGGAYNCTGAANAAADVTQTLSGGPLTVTTTPGFGIDTSTSGGDALKLTGNSGALSFTDNYASAITGALSGIDARNYGAGAAFGDASKCQPSEPVHVLQMHGTKDETIPYAGVTAPVAYPSARGSVEQWAKHNGCDLTPDESAAAIDIVSGIDGAETKVSRYTKGCKPGGSGELWTIEGAGHIPILSKQFAPAVLDYFNDELERAMALCGVTRIDEIDATLLANS